jgi:uncharacterized membrane protein YgcG
MTTRSFIRLRRARLWLAAGAALALVLLLGSGPAQAKVGTTISLSAPSSVTLTATSDCGQTFCATIDYSAVLTVSDSDYPADQVSIVCNDPRGTTYSWGQSMTTCYAQDPAGNRSAPVMFTVYVNIPSPTFQNVPAPTFAATGPAGGVATWAPPTATDVGGQSVPVQCDHQSGITYPIGVTTVTCTAQIERNDSNGNPIGGLPSANVQFAVTITQQSSSGSGSGSGSSGGSGTNTGGPQGGSPSGQTDSTAPTIKSHPAVVVDASSPAGAVVKYAVSATDPGNTSGQVTVVCAPGSGRLFHLAAGGKTKTTTVTCQAHDAAGNAATPITFTVKVLGFHDQLLALELGIDASGLSVKHKVALVSALTAADRAFRVGRRAVATRDLAGFATAVHALPLKAAERRSWLAAATRLLAIAR